MHLYIHVPFCARRCSYCDFAIAVRREVPSREYVDLLLAEWHRCVADDDWVKASPLETIHLGGGTPSRLDPREIARLLDGVRTSSNVAPTAEIAIEANPDDVTPDVVRIWTAAGVNRVSLGAQSFDPQVLQWMHRTHTAAQVGRAVDALRSAGVDNVSLDLIFALPTELGRDWGADLDAAFALEPAHLSLYGLTVETHTPLAHWIHRGEWTTVTDERYAGEYLVAAERFTRAGWDHYEVSNAARPGFRSAHNQAYWRRRPYLGVGPSAHSAHARLRRWNIREWVAWRAVVAEGRSPVEDQEQLDAPQRLLEERYLGLRTSDGVPLDLVTLPQRAAWIHSGWATEDDTRLRLTAEGWLRLDSLIASL